MLTSPGGAALRLRRRLARLADEWPRPQAEVVAAVVEDPSPGGALSSLAERPPYWLVLPCELAAAWVAGGELPEEDLDGLLWGQFCLFLAIRLQDDLLDGDVEDAALQFVANRFLVESLEAFERAELPPEFRRELRRCIRATSDGILAVQKLESRWGGFGEAHLPLHAEASAVLRVGAAAVCFRLERPGDLSWLEEVSDRLVVVGQICDDLKDLAEDLGRGRFTWVANRLGDARPVEKATLDECERRVRRGLLSARRTGEIFAVARSQLAAGEWSAATAGAPAGILDRVARVKASLDRFERGLHEDRVRSVLGDPNLRSGSSPPPG